MGSLTNTVERVQEVNTARREQITQRVAAAQRSDAAARGTLPDGSIVFDVTSGADAEVVPRTFAPSTGENTIAIRLASGQVVARRRVDVIVRPTPPEVK